MNLKERTIINVWGASNSGKSSSIRMAHQELLKKLDSSYIFDPADFHSKGPDFEEIEKFANLKIAFFGSGDDLWAAKGHAHYSMRYLVGDLKEEEIAQIENEEVRNDYSACDVIVVASRIRNNVADFIEEMAQTHGYRVLRFHPIQSKKPREHVNHYNGKQLVQMVEDVALGKL
ncbi:hypothetical protein AB9P05_00360 [Roseivirga sp. BDSF3-8]|uniref:hypothetical protein n=1 Tax=Roseivirga sp. BDSF3-8 TaxID=3241598 RepID=UPI003531EBC9